MVILQMKERKCVCERDREKKKKKKKGNSTREKKKQEKEKQEREEFKYDADQLRQGEIDIQRRDWQRREKNDGNEHGKNRKEKSPWTADPTVFMDSSSGRSLVDSGIPSQSIGTPYQRD